MQSYRVVPVALQWLAKRQDKDGSWSFANSGRTGEPTWTNPGTWQSKQGATGLVLLCYLSAGQTHKTRGPYRENIAAGLKFLMSELQAETQRRPTKATKAKPFAGTPWPPSPCARHSR